MEPSLIFQTWGGFIFISPIISVVNFAIALIILFWEVAFTKFRLVKNLIWVFVFGIPLAWYLLEFSFLNLVSILAMITVFIALPQFGAIYVHRWLINRWPWFPNRWVRPFFAALLTFLSVAIWCVCGFLTGATPD